MSWCGNHTGKCFFSIQVEAAVKRFFRNFGILILCFVMIGSLGGGIYLNQMLSAFQHEETPAQTPRTTVTQMVNDETGETTELEVEVDTVSEEEAKYYDWNFGSDYINILCIGIDTRKVESDFGLTDVMIIASIDLTSNRIRLVSLMRDIYVNPSGYSGHTKLNSVYASYGGMDELMRTINDKFGTNLSKYVLVNFFGMKDIIDRIGGVDIDVSEKEVGEVNRFLHDIYDNLGTSVPQEEYLTEAGMQHLDGAQATTYARIRSVGNGDFERTQRQRIVLEAMLAKMKTVGLLAWPGVFNDCKDMVKTNLTPDEMLAIGFKVLRMKNVEMEQLRIPMDGTWIYQTVDGLSYVVINFEDNRKAIQQFLVGDYVAPENQ